MQATNLRYPGAGMLKLGGGIALLMVAAFMTIGLFAGGGAEHGLAVQIFVALITIGIPGAGGILLLRQHHRQRLLGPGAHPELPPERHPAELIKLAARKGGRLTVVEAVAEAHLTPDEAQAAFDELCHDGHAEPQVTESGLVVYAFRDLLLLDEKHRSRGLLDP